MALSAAYGAVGALHSVVFSRREMPFFPVEISILVDPKQISVVSKSEKGFPFPFSLSIFFLVGASGVASPICQEGQSKRPFPIFALFIFFPDFPLFSLIFSLFLVILLLLGATLPHLDPPVATQLVRALL